ncbi:hypothetical protein A3A21_01295 [Candidatus Jorgensenbacteria bacterium RIFCSPLOWO2_01_FULL_45_25b]|uniref:Cell shape-determining protein MreC n=1 Tax=Candidatus Jorgensenbacteria bacterium RIFCSPLOWO2_01_FULL_45_25b TaxID=1798471 RepID=A0A1F6BVK7_9BACT|nr:MAG: hypothetical protein A3A21_01295 [Candidatus Jorgensenbacteria bacterium RIFCSPLOWO2_01_FULL_45_25b]
MRSFGSYLALVFVLFAVFGAVFFHARIFDFLSRARLLARSFSDQSFRYEKTLQLEVERDLLRNEVAIFKNRALSKDDVLSGSQYTSAPLYSLYPYQDKSLLVIEFGSSDGARLGSPVFAFPRVLLGEISSVRDTQSEVKTIFDTRWVSSVVIEPDPKRPLTERREEEPARGVLKGGLSPHVELVPKYAFVEEGDLVINTSPKFPYGTILGIVEKAELGGENFWSRIVVRPFFELDDIYRVFVLASFP